MRFLLPLLLISSIAASSIASAQGTDRERALGLLEESASLYEAGRFAEAATLLRRAHELHADPALLFNLGRALEGAGDTTAALEAYRLFVEQSDDVARVGDAQLRIRALAEASETASETDADADADADTDAADTDTESGSESSGSEALGPESGHAARSPLGPIFLGVGLGTLLAGAATGIAALRLHALADTPSTSQERADQANRRARRLGRSADVLLSIGLIDSLVGAVLTVRRGRVEASAGLGRGELRLRF